MTRRNRSRLQLVTCAALLSALATVGVKAPAAAPDDAPASLETWSSAVWQSALDGRRRDVERFLTDAPKESMPETIGSRFRETMDLRQTNREKARNVRQQAMEDALAKLEEHLAEDDLINALESAVEVQTLSDDMAAMLEDEQFSSVIAWAQKQIPEVEKKHDWLYAQELLYSLRTLYEDTGRHAEYQKYDEHLDRVNRRVSLLAMYAPKRLYELQNARTIRHGDDPLDEFNPALAIDWNERVREVTVAMLKQAMRTASHEHIESSGYRPMLMGGLEQLELLATTSALSETFEKLDNEQKVRRWVEHIEDELRMLREMDDDEVDSITASRILDGLVWMNDKTLELPRPVIYREFGEGAMFRLDRFSEIIWPEKLRRFQQATEGNFVGVGILIRHNDKREIVVVNPLEGTPAYFAGVKPDDVIVEVDGEPTVGWSLNDAVDRITGKPNTEVEIGLRREDHDGIIRLTIERDVIKLPSVRGWWKEGLAEDGEPIWDWYIDSVSGIAYIRLTQFTEDSYSDLLKAWQQITRQGEPRGLILDLRYNPGGLLESAVRVSNLFVRNGLIVAGEDKNQQAVWELKADPRRAAWQGVPTVVLINKGSASASEIVSGCLKAYDAAVIVGERSYGKGSVQTVHPITNNSLLKLTTQYFRMPASPDDPNGPLIHKRPGAERWGVEPDVQVKMTPTQVSDSIKLRQEADIIPLEDDDNGDAQSDADGETEQRPDINRLLTEGMDPQLEVALLLLQARALGAIDDSGTKHARRDQ